MKLELTVRDGLLRFFDPATGEYLHTLEEAKRLAATERREKEAAQRLAAAERREREAAQARIAELEAKLRARRGSD